MPATLLLGAGLSNPDESQHREALLDAVRAGHAVSASFDPSDRERPPADYRSYLLFSVTRHHDRLTTVGAFGRVVPVGHRGRHP